MLVGLHEENLACKQCQHHDSYTGCIITLGAVESSY